MKVTTKVYQENLNALLTGEYRVIANKGGTRSGKTYSLVSLLLSYAVVAKHSLTIDIVSESLPHLKRGAMNDMDDITSAEGMAEGVQYELNRSDHIYSFPNGAKVRFFSADDWGKVKGSKRDILFINECNRIPWEVYRQLAVRTTDTIFLDWNPDAEFWYEEQGISGRANTIEIHSTYKDNPYLSEVQIAEIESNKDDASWWQVYGLGLTGRPQGVIYKRWKQVDGVPPHARLVGRGLDFGFMADPTAIVDVYMADGALWLDERLYKTGLTNDLIAQHIRGLNGATVADSAEMKSIQEIRNYGVPRIEAAVKGQDSVRHGIQVLQRYEMNVTSRSLNLIHELRNYKWKEEKITGKLLNEPVDKWNHALDAVRYVALNKLAERGKGGLRARYDEVD